MELLDGSCKPSERLLRDFYEALISLSVLDPSVLARATPFDGRKEIDDNSGIIKFLDRLSWMCDTEPAGLSVCAIAMQPTETGTVFWFATQYKFVRQTRVNLGRLLVKLKTAATLSESEAERLKRELCTYHINFAAEKVRNYAQKLSKRIEKVSKSEATSDVQLLRDLQRLKDVVGNAAELCCAADHFRDSESLRRITQKIEARGLSDDWSSLRHYIGRLGSWHRAARTLVEYARTKPELFTAFKVEPVEIPKPKRAPGPNGSTDLLSALQRMWPLEQESELSRAVNALDRLRRSDIAEDFKQAYGDKNFKPRVHAEVGVLEHFHSNNLPFVGAYRYIGCSKPSCYCCDLYFNFHPGQFIRRQSHGNVWTKWASAFAETTETGQSILQAMTEVIRRDVKAQLYGQLIKQPKMPDSTTGISNSQHG